MHRTEEHLRHRAYAYTAEHVGFDWFDAIKPDAWTVANRPWEAPWIDVLTAALPVGDATRRIRYEEGHGHRALFVETPFGTLDRVTTSRDLIETAVYGAMADS